MPQLDTTYFASQIFWLCIFFTIFYLSVKYLILPRIESIIKARILVTKDSEKLAEEFAKEIEEIKNAHKARAEEVRDYVKKMQLDSKKKYESFSQKANEELQNKLSEKMIESEKKIEKFAKDFHKSKDSADLITEIASKVIGDLTSVKVDKSQLKKYEVS